MNCFKLVFHFVDVIIHFLLDILYLFKKKFLQPHKLTYNQKKYFYTKKEFLIYDFFISLF